MNPFSMMMAASRAVNKKEEVVAIKPDSAQLFAANIFLVVEL